MADRTTGAGMIPLFFFLMVFSLTLLLLDLLIPGAMLGKFIGAATVALVSLCAALPWIFNTLYPKLGIVLEQRMRNEEGFSANPPHGNLLGKTGVALTDLHPVGRARIEGRNFDVMAENFLIAHGTVIVVVAVEGAKVIVRAA